MLKEAFLDGLTAALMRFGVKEAFSTAGWGAKAMNWGKAGLTSLKQNIMGSPEKIWADGLSKSFAPGGELHHSNVFWPKSWVGRAFGTVLPAYGVYQSMKNPDPSETPMTNFLRSAGGAVGQAYGYTGLGMLGGPVVGRAGASLGQGLGRILSGRPRQPQLPPAPPPQAQPDPMMAQPQQAEEPYR